MTFDLAIIGSGFAGTILARVMCRRGWSVLLIEKGRHPRFALGESTTPLANFSLERLADRYGLEDLFHLSSHGRWLAGLPHLRRGLKRGFTFFDHRPGELFANSPKNEARLLVAASPNDGIADTHWLRSDVDHHLVSRAVEEGIEFRQGTTVHAVDPEEEGLRLTLSSDSGQEMVTARKVVDGSGSGAVLARTLGVASTSAMGISTALLAGHFEGVRPFAEVLANRGARLTQGPYPDDWAAVHHLLAEGWMYVLPFDHGVASVGLVLRRGEDLPPDEVFEKRPLQIFRRLVRRYPDLKRAFEGARPTLPLVFQPQLAHRRRRAVVKNGWLLPHTFAFFDPLFSTGMAWSLIAVERLAQLLEGEHGSAEEYQRLLDREASQLARLIEAAHLSMRDFRLFRAICGLYFITVSFAEAQQRLLREEADRPLAWQGFLGAGEHRLERIFQRTLEVLRRGRSRGFSTAEVEEFDQWLDLELRPFDLVGFRISERNNLHPVDLDLLIERAHLLGMSRREMVAGVKRLRGQAESLQRWQPGQ